MYDHRIYRMGTRVRSDLPGYLADSEADGVCVINYYHKQFKQAAKKGYFLDDTVRMVNLSGKMPNTSRHPVEHSTEY